MSQPYDPNQPVPGTRDEAPRDSLPGAPVTYGLGPDGVPVPMPVPAEFAPHVPDALTAEEIAEFRALRDEKKRRDAEAAEEAAAAAGRLQPATHLVHLADGSVVDGSAVETHVDNGHGPYAVTGAFLKPEFVTFPG
jgi:hypothetical protein